MTACDRCGDKFRTEIKLKWHILETPCNECEGTWECENEYNVHIDQKHKFKCKICKSKFAKESTLEYHSQVWWCNTCDLKVECEQEFANHKEEDHDLPFPPHIHHMWYCEACDSIFKCESDLIDHASHMDHWRVKKLEPNWTAKIPLEAFKKSANDDEHDDDKAPTDSGMQVRMYPDQPSQIKKD